MDKIYDFKTGKFYASYRDIVTFDLIIRKPITQIYGQSAAGKTLLVNFIKNEKKNAKFNVSTTDLSNIAAYDDDISVKIFSGIKKSLIVIDRGDLLINHTIADYIRDDDDNNYLIFSRTSLPLGLSPNYYGEFICDSNNIVTIDYKFNEVSWF